jgi:hypothetical protein
MGISVGGDDSAFELSLTADESNPVGATGDGRAAGAACGAAAGDAGDADDLSAAVDASDAGDTGDVSADCAKGTAEPDILTDLSASVLSAVLCAIDLASHPLQLDWMHSAATTCSSSVSVGTSCSAGDMGMAGIANLYTNLSEGSVFASSTIALRMTAMAAASSRWR